MLLLSVLLVVNYQQEPHLKVLYMQSPVDHRTLELLYPYDGWLAVLRIVDFTGRHVVHSALWQIKVKLTKYVVIVFNRGEHTLCNDTSWKTVIWIWAEIQLVVNCNLGIKTWGKPCMFLSHEFLISFNAAQQWPTISCEWLIKWRSPHYIFHCAFKLAGINIRGDHVTTKTANINTKRNILLLQYTIVCLYRVL